MTTSCGDCKNIPHNIAATTINVPLLMKTLQAVRHEAAKPVSESLWNQSEFFAETDCGTVRCFAGWAVTLAGHTPYETYQGSTFDCAVSELGITQREAQHLFICTVSAPRDLELIETIVASILSERGLDIALPTPAPAETKQETPARV